MNTNCYKVIFSKRLGTLVAVGEHTTSSGKTASGQADRGFIHAMPSLAGMANGFVGILRFSFASIALACLSLNTTQAQSSLPTIATNALPQGASVNTGSASISTIGAQMAITQSSDKASINWQSFNVGTGASVNIAQPSASAVLLNRVVGNDPSQILGKLSANGQVILLNPNGILFGKDGSVTASAFTASTFGLSDADFMNGYYKYNRNGSAASVVNQGTIEVSRGGYVALIGATVTNEGKIIAPQGDVVMAAADSVTLPEELVAPKPNAPANTVSVRMSKRVRLELDPAAINTAINNTESSVIVTEGGQVLLQAAAISAAVASVTHSGNIDTSAPQAGAVTLLADNGAVKVDGTIKSNSSGNHNGTTNRGGDIIIGRDEENGALSKTTDVSAAKLESSHGFVETSGQHVIVDGIQVKADQWLLDPTDITITSADSGVANSGTNPITVAPNTSGTTASTINASTLETNLSAGTNVIVKTTNASGTGNGDITVASNIAVTGSSDATLTLQAERDIVISSNVSIARTGTNKLNVVLNSDLDGNGAGAIKMNLGSIISTNGGNITLGGGTAGDGSDNAIGNATYNSGIALSGTTLSAGGGHISLKGQSGTAGTTDSASGISITGSSSISTTGAGNISLTGSSVATSGSQDTGIRIIGTSSTTLATITGGSTGSVSMTGTATNASTSGSYQHGIQLQNVKASTTGGNISLTGTGGATSGTSAGTGNNRGIAFESAAEVSATGVGTVTLTGVGGSGGPSATSSNLGVFFNNTNNNIKSESGAIFINASATDNTSYAASLGGTIASSSNGNITVTTDSITLGGTISTGTGTVTVQNATAGTYITAGGTTTDVRTTNPKTMVVDATELGKITASTTVIGRNDATGSGNVTVNALNMGALGNTAGNLTVLSGNDITVADTITKSTGTDATLILNAKNGVAINAAVGGAVSGAGKLNISATSNGLGSSVRGITAASTINANGGTVNLTSNVSSGKAISFNNGSGINAASYTVNGISTSTAGASPGVYFSGSSNFVSSGASLINGTSMGQSTAFTAGLWMDNGAAISFNAGSSGSLIVKGSNAAWQTGIRIGNAGGNSTPTITTNGDVTIGALEANSNITFRNGTMIANSGTLNIKGQVSSLGGNAVSLYDAYSITANNGANISIAGQLDATSGTAVNIGPAGGTNITANSTGNVSISGTASLGGTAVAIANGATISSGGTTTITATSTASGASIASSGANTFSATGGMTVNINNAGELTGVITGGTANAGGLTKTGAGTLKLSGANTLSGTTLVTAGTLALNNINALQNSILNTGTSGSQLVTFTVSGTNTYNLGGLQGDDSLAIGANGISVGSNNSTTIYSGVISGSGDLTKVGTGNLTLSGQSTKTGNYNANAGTLTLTGATGTYRDFSNLNVYINNGATVAIPNIVSGGFVSNNVTWNFGSAGGGALNISSNFVNRGVNGNKFVTTGGATNTISGNINLDANGGGAGPTFDIASGTAGVAGLIHTGNTSNGNSAQGLTKTGAGILVLTGTNDYKGAITVNAGALQLGNDSTTGILGANAGTVTVGSGATLQVNRSNAFSLTNTITGTGNFGQIGAGTTTLTANNTYSGTTTVSGGTLQVGEAGTTGLIGTGAVSLANNANLNFVRAATTSISNDISGTGNLNATISGTNSDLTLAGTTSITGAIAASATGSILTTGGKNISTSSGLSLAGQNGVAIYANITNSTSGAVNITAGDNTTTSTAAIVSAAGATITQNAAAAVTMTTDALGDLTVAKIIKGAGAGDVTVASGIKLAAGVAGGDIKTVAANPITNNGTGKTLIYTGSSAESGLMSNLNGSLATLYLTANTGHAQNAITRTAYGSGGGFAGGPTTQVLFREAADITPSISGNTLTKNYGDAAPSTAELITALTAANNGATISASSAAATLVASTADAISDIANHVSLNASNNSYGRINANASGYSYSASDSSYAINGASPNLALIVNKINAAVTANSDSTKIYNGLTQTVSGFAATGLLSGETESALTGVTSTGSGMNVGTYTTTALGTDTNYNLSFTTGSLIIGKANVSAVGTKVYDASNTFTSSNFTSITGVNGETFTPSGSGTVASANVHSNQALSGLGTLSLTGVSGALTSNYNNFSVTNTSISVTQRPLTVTGSQNSSSYNGLSQSNTGASISGTQGLDSFTVTGYGTGTNASTTTYADNLSLTGNGSSLTSNYNITYTNGGLTIGKANLSAIGTKVFDASNSFSGANFTSISGVNGETFTASGSGTLASVNVQSNQALTSLGSLSLSGVSGSLTSNYNALTTAQTSVSVTQRALNVTGTNTSVTYNGSAHTNANATIIGTQGTDSFTVTGYGAGTNASATAYADNLSSTGNGSTLLSNYNIHYSNGGLTIGKANLTLSGTRVYDGGTTYAGAYLTAAGVNSETFTVTGLGDASNLASKNIQNNQLLISVTGLTLGSNSNGGLSSNYNALTTNGSSVSVTAKSATLNATGTSLTYNGSTQNQSAPSTSGFISSDDIRITGLANGKNVNTYTSHLAVSGNDVNNYSITINDNNLVINKAPLTVTATQVNKTYDGTTSAEGSPAVAALAGVNAGEVVNSNGFQVFTNANAGTGKTVQASDVSIKNASSIDVTSNYDITYVNNTTSVIDKASLAVKANNDARFVTLSDAVGYNGVTYSGFVGTETSSSLGGALTITRQNANTNVAAGSYTGTLTPAGLTSTNYDFNYVNGNYTIVQANTLLVKTTNQTLNYGSAPVFSTTAEYLDAEHNVIHTLTPSISGNNYTFTDGATGSASFTMKAYTATGSLATSSSSGNTFVGVYDVLATNPTIIGNNFNGIPVFVGALTILAKSVSPSATNVSKAYDGTTSITNISLGLTGTVANDSVIASGTGTFNQKNAGQGLGYSYNNITLTGTDTGNYYLNGGINHLSGTNGIITPAPLTLSSSNVSKVYDGTTSANGSAQVIQGTQLFGTDSITGETFSFTDPSVGISKTVQLSGVTVNDDNSGNNYTITYVDNTQSSIKRAQTAVAVAPIPPISSTASYIFTPDSFKARLRLDNQGASSLNREGLESCISGATSDCVCKAQNSGSNEDGVSCSSSSTSVKSNSAINSDS